ncbi:MAG: B12-binding domain-containing radical SAM protein, partial [Syntrophobacteraceae bacterium]
YQLFPQENPGADLFDLDNLVVSIGQTADVVGFSCMANLLPFTILAAQRFKLRHPEKTILLGGVGPFGVERQILERFPWIDIIFRGEAEVSLPRLMRALQTGGGLQGVPGMFYRSGNGAIVENAPPPRICELDAIPFPAYHRIDRDKYDAFGVISSRGCPYECTFCSAAPVWNRKTTYRSHESIIEEIKLLYEGYGVDLVLFQDEFFYSGEAKILDFCDRLAKSGPPVRWKCFGRVNLVSEAAMRRMAESGCIQIRFGVESGADRVLEKIVKGFRFEDALRAVSQAAAIFDSVETFFIWGFPFEEPQDFFETAIQMMRFRQLGITVLPSLFSMLPQTRIYRDYRAGRYKGTLELVPQLIPIYMVTGHEVLGEQNSVPEKYRFIYDFIGAHPDVFPGFHLLDYQSAILPKYEAMRQMGLA